jgi:hypothetical protein
LVDGWDVWTVGGRELSARLALDRVFLHRALIAGETLVLDDGGAVVNCSLSIRRVDEEIAGHFAVVGDTASR